MIYDLKQYDCDNRGRYYGATEMAQWKDEQYKYFVSKEAVFNILKEEHDISAQECVTRWHKLYWDEDTI